MHKRMLRLLALMLTLAMALSLAACGQDAPAGNDQESPSQKSAETEAAEGKPMVRLYFCTERLGTGYHEILEYEEKWWEKESFFVTEYRLDEQGSELYRRQHTYANGEICTAPWGGRYIAQVSRYENGEKVYSRFEYAEEETGMLSSITTLRRDQFGRLIEDKTEYDYEGTERDEVRITTIEYEETDRGSVGIGDYDGVCYERHYDEYYRLLETIVSLNGDILTHEKYEYNEAGCLISWELTGVGGETYHTEYIYDYIEVPLSVAEKWSMFKWEYID